MTEISFNKTPREIFETHPYLKFKDFQVLSDWLLRISISFKVEIDITYLIISILKFIETSTLYKESFEIFFTDGYINRKYFLLLGASYLEKLAYNIGNAIVDLLCQKEYSMREFAFFRDNLPSYFNPKYSDSMFFVIFDGNTVIGDEIKFSLEKCFEIIRIYYKLTGDVSNLKAEEKIKTFIHDPTKTSQDIKRLVSDSYLYILLFNIERLDYTVQNKYKLKEKITDKNIISEKCKDSFDIMNQEDHVNLPEVYIFEKNDLYLCFSYEELKK